MTRPSYFYFDLGNVLVFFDHGKCVHNLATLAGVPDARMRHIVFESGLWDRYESVAISSLEFVQAIEHAVQKSLDPTAVLEAAADMFWENENESILPVLDHVQRQGIRLASSRTPVKLTGTGSSKSVIEPSLVGLSIMY